MKPRRRPGRDRRPVRQGRRARPLEPAPGDAVLDRPGWPRNRMRHLSLAWKAPFRPDTKRLGKGSFECLYLCVFVTDAKIQGSTVCDFNKIDIRERPFHELLRVSHMLEAG